MNTDVIIVGKGIAGLVLSFLLKKKGIQHLVLDRKSKKKHFALAETLPPSSMPLLHALDLIKIFEKNTIRKTYGYHSMWGNTRVLNNDFFSQLSYKNGLKINKKTLVDDLEELCNMDMVSYEKMLNMIISKEEVIVEVENDHQKVIIKGKMIIDATGRNRAILNKLKIPIRLYDNLISFSCHLPRIEHSKLTYDIFVESFEDGWGIVSGLDEKTNVLSIFTNKDNLIQLKLRDYSNWQSVLSKTTLLKDFLVEQPEVKIVGLDANSSIANYLSGENWLAVGDAALSFDPLSSHGIANAIYTVREASDAIESYILTGDRKGFVTYSKTLFSIFDSYYMVKNGLYRAESRWMESSFWKKFFQSEGRETHNLPRQNGTGIILD
ncbi:flavin-dependent dehydrogenase [Aquimarina sp. MAR_2010_214]|uniref:NAD(P)/FAD-dependent oxidoreductase n=1 Tax=Aquimarina sp. MAR_2010_214 TaxID=1250026 RepID=UPI000C712EF2|nr:FAD-dependent monooxygenase [Aquimarina sp. MAR_2010_214]PKV51630.1 flavin-dependent dehydrogenase [Aquimarina sp. MAR_2010_214]